MDSLIIGDNVKNVSHLYKHLNKKQEGKIIEFRGHRNNMAFLDNGCIIHRSHLKKI